MTHDDLDRAIDLVRDVRDNLGLDSTYYTQISQATVLQYATDLSDAVEALVEVQMRLEGEGHHD